MMQVEQGFIPALSLRTNAAQNGADPEGFEVATADACCLAIESVHSLPEFFVSEEQLRSRLMHELTLVHGIGGTREQMCRRRGIQTLADLRRTNWKSEAQAIAEIIQSGTPREVIRLFRERGRGADPLRIGFGAAVPKEELLFFDIETLGMVHSPIILFGCGVCEGRTLRVTQYLFRDISEEIAALELVAEMMRAHPALVTYNGRSFDLPFTNSRLPTTASGNAVPRCTSICCIPRGVCSVKTCRTAVSELWKSMYSAAGAERISPDTLCPSIIRSICVPATPLL